MNPTQPVFTVEYTQQALNNGQTLTNLLYTLPDHRSSMVTITVIVHDVNSDTNRHFFKASYAWYREWTNAPTKVLLHKDYDDTTKSGPAVYTMDTLAKGNDILFSISQAQFATNSYYTVVAEVYFATL